MAILTPPEKMLANIAGIAAHSSETRAAMDGYNGRDKAPHFSTFGKLVGWVGYWACSVVNFHLVNSAEEMAQCRRWCEQTRAWAENITDLEMWAALVEWRAERRHSHELEQTFDRAA